MNANTFASTMNIKTTDDGLVHGNLGSLKKTVAFMGFDCETSYVTLALGDEMTKVNVTDNGTTVATILAVNGEAALVWH
jgi:hypothetical protein